MAGIDASIYGQLQQPANPLAMAQGFADYQARLQQNKLLQMEVEGKQGQATAAQGAFDDQGNFDPTKYGLNAKSVSPYAAPLIAPQAMDLQGHLQDITNKARAQAGLVLGARISNDDYDPVGWSKDIQAATASGAINPMVAKEVLQAIADTGGDPDKLKSVAQRYVLQSMGSGAYIPSITTAEPSGGTTIKAPASIVGAHSPAPPAVPAARAGTNAPASVGVAASTPFSAPASLPPQSAQAFDRVNKRIAAADGSGQRLAQLQTLDEMNEKFPSGPASDDLMTMAKLFNELTGGNVAVDATNAADVFKKTAIQFAASQGFNLPPTDLGALERLESNPNTSMAHDAIHQIVGKLMGIEELNQAAQKYFQAKQGAPADQQAQAATDWSQHENPFVFQVEHMTPKDKKDYMEALSKNKSQFTKFRDDFLFYKHNGLLPDQGAASAQ